MPDEGLEPLQDVKRWWLVLEDGEDSVSVTITVSGRELLMNKELEALKALLGNRFDEAARTLREEFLKRA